MRYHHQSCLPILRVFPAALTFWTHHRYPHQITLIKETLIKRPVCASHARVRRLGLRPEQNQMLPRSIWTTRGKSTNILYRDLYFASRGSRRSRATRRYVWVWVRCTYLFIHFCIHVPTHTRICMFIIAGQVSLNPQAAGREGRPGNGLTPTGTLLSSCPPILIYRWLARSAVDHQPSRVLVRETVLPQILIYSLIRQLDLYCKELNLR